MQSGAFDQRKGGATAGIAVAASITIVAIAVLVWGAAAGMDVRWMVVAATVGVTSALVGVICVAMAVRHDLRARLDQLDGRVTAGTIDAYALGLTQRVAAGERGDGHMRVS